ncbi:MAG TPA: TonB family protein [Allosphingosinicella sp.]|nr:TonB family protein [Allosphingosinicella sp.]
MASVVHTRNDQRGKAAVAVALLHLALGYALIVGLGVDFRRAIEAPLRIISIEVPPPPEPTIPAPVRRPEPEGAAAPQSLKARPTPVVAPREAPSRSWAVPMPMPVATGTAREAGASTDPGTGTGGGGEGAGAGSGRGGSGTGGGGLASRARRLSGTLDDSDYPGRGRRDRIESVSVRFTVGADGRVGACTVARSSGNPRLDSVTCNLIERRFRYRPATDGRGEPVPSVVSTSFDWVPPALNRRR